MQNIDDADMVGRKVRSEKKVIKTKQTHLAPKSESLKYKS
jgi:hypothetical protein